MVAQDEAQGGEAVKQYSYFNDKERKPIILNRDTLATISIYKKKFNFLELEWDDPGEPPENLIRVFNESADEFVRQLEDEWCEYFMDALIRAIKKQIRKTKKELGIQKPVKS